jgi:F-type H+-transporting ATPase subunit epsilon
MAKLNVEIVTPERRILQVQADEVVAPGAEGLFGIRPGHTPFLSVMQAGALTLKGGASTDTYFVAGGFVEVTNDKVLVLADQAEPATEIDVDLARRRLEDAQQRLKGLSPEDARFAVERATVERETVRMSLAGRR